jgi:TPR repeat protein
MSVKDAVAPGAEAYKNKQTREEACWQEFAAKQGDPEAEFYLGLSYYFGRAGVQNRDKAIHLLKFAAQKGTVKHFAPQWPQKLRNG